MTNAPLFTQLGRLATAGFIVAGIRMHPADIDLEVSIARDSPIGSMIDQGERGGMTLHGLRLVPDTTVPRSEVRLEVIASTKPWPA